MPTSCGVSGTLCPVALLRTRHSQWGAEPSPSAIVISKRRRRTASSTTVTSCRNKQGDGNIDKSTAGNAAWRREVLLAGLAAHPALLCGSSSGSPFFESKATVVGFDRGDGDSSAALVPLADVPMQRLKLPSGAAGRDYVLVQLMVQGTGPHNFMLDSGLTSELITPHLQRVLNIREETGGPRVRGLGAGGATGPGALVELKGAALCCGKFAQPGASELPLPPLNAVVTDFPQEHLDPEHDPVEGMLGMEFLNVFDSDLDFKNGRLRLWPAGSAARLASRAGLTPIPAAVLNETGLLGIRIAAPPTPTQPTSPQPILGIVDCGASFSIVNWSGAHYLGLPPRGDASYGSSPTVYGLGVDGKPFPLHTAPLRLTFSGDPYRAEDGGVAFRAPRPPWRPWEPITIAVGNLPVFSQLLGDGRGGGYGGPAALLGLDVWAQRRVIFECCPGEGGRKRRLFVSNR